MKKNSRLFNFVFILSLILFIALAYASLKNVEEAKRQKEADLEAARIRREHSILTEEEKRLEEERERQREKTIADYNEITGSHRGYLLANGNKLYIARKENIAQIYLEEADGQNSKAVTDSAEPVDGYSVSPEEKQLIYLASKGGNERYGFYLVDLESGATEPLLVNDAVRYGDPTWLSENEILFTSNEANGSDFYIYHLDLKTRKQTLLVSKAGNNHITDAISKKEFLFYTYNSNTSTTPYHYKNGKANKFKGINPNKRYFPIAFFKDGILMRTNENDDFDYLELWKGKEHVPFFKRYWTVESAVVDKKTRDTAAFCSDEDGFSACRYYDKNGEFKLVEYNKSVISLGSLRDGKLVMDITRSQEITRPHIYDVETGSLQTFGYFFYNSISLEEFSNAELRHVLSFDNENVSYLLYRPRTGNPPYQTIVYFHGGPEGQSRPSFSANFQYYLSKGYAVVAPNVRGSSGYGERFMNLDNYKLRMNAVKDGKAVIDELLKEGISAPNRFIAMGGSYGGFMTVASMAEFADDYICGIDNVGVVDLVNFLENTSSYRRHLREAEYGPLSDKEFLQSISPTNMVDKIKGELYVFHGANDPRVPVSDAYILIDRLKKAGKKVQSHIFEDEGHGYRKKVNRNIYFTKSAEFIQNNCTKK